MPKLKNITGQRFGRLIAVEYIGRKNRESQWLCKCDCGNFAICGLQNLQHPRMHSCGCWLQEGNMFRKHSGCFTLTYSSWASLKARCLTPSDRHYSDYGGRGIKVCDRWLGEHGFENFLADMGERPTLKHSIDRIDVNGNYEPSNCRWATSVVQANNKRNNIIIEHNGETHSLCDWCRMFGVDSTRARKRYMRGLSFEQIFAKETLPKPGSKGALSDEEVRFIRNHIGNYDNCKSLFMKQYGKHIEMGMYYGIRARRSYKNVI